MQHVLPPLPYDHAALEPYIDTRTMMLHHDKHHASYVANLNSALEKYCTSAPRPGCCSTSPKYPKQRELKRATTQAGI